MHLLFRRRLFAFTNSLTLRTNSTVELNILSNANMIGTTTLDPNFWTVGKSIHVYLRGLYFSGASVTGTNGNIKLNGTSIATNLQAFIANVVGLGDPCDIEFTITCTAVGASGAVICNGKYMIPSSAGGTSMVGRRYWNSAGAVTIDTTASLPLTMTMHFGQTTTSLQIRSGYAMVIP